MADPHVVTALVRKRAELAGDMENAHDACARWLPMSITRHCVVPYSVTSPRAGHSLAMAVAMLRIMPAKHGGANGMDCTHA